MMENKNIAQVLQTDTKLFFTILDELENELENQGKTWIKELIDLYVLLMKTHKCISYFHHDERVRKFYEKHMQLKGIHSKYIAVVALLYLNYLQASPTAKDLTDLSDRTGKFLAFFAELNRISSRSSASLSTGEYYFDYVYSLSPVMQLQEAYGFLLITNLISRHVLSYNLIDPKFFESVKVKKLETVYNKESFEFKIPQITSAVCFRFSNELSGLNGGKTVRLFEQESIIIRMYMAILLDNPSVLNIFFNEYKSYYPNQALEDCIANYALVGLAAANGCIEIMKLFVKMEVNLEQKFRIHTDTYGGTDSKNVLFKHMGSVLEMTPLALALSAAPSLVREDARTMIGIFLEANANYNNKIIKTWTEKVGYYNNERTVPKSAVITLFGFDQTGILDELAKKKREQKTIPKKVSVHAKAKKDRASTEDHSKVSELQLEMEKLKLKNISLEEEVAKLKLENTALKNEVATLQSSLPKKLTLDSTMIIQAAARGFFARKEYREKIKQEVKASEKEVKQKLVQDDKDEELMEFMQAIKQEDWSKAMEIMRNITVSETKTVQLDPSHFKLQN